jgi:hypothetical protein
MITKHSFAALSLALLLAACATKPMKVGPGEAVVADKVALRIDGAWNQLPTQMGPWTLWTHDGLALDELRFWTGLKDGEAIASPMGKDQRPLAFKASMQPHELVALFGSLHSRDGSAFTLDRLEPAEFVGAKGFRFQYTVVRKTDDVKLSGVGWGAVHNNQLYAMTFTAPRAGFFGRHEKGVEQIAKSARLKG